MALKVIGLTGGIASGKSTVSTLLKSLGAVIIDADEISRKVMKKNTKVFDEIVEYFGDNILDKDGNIDRQKLGQIVFSNVDDLKILNDITHPAIINEIKKNLLILSKKKEPIVVIDAALLLESGLDNLTDKIWLVKASEETQLKRLMRRDNIDERQAINRIKSQMPLKEKLKYADKIIDNDGNIEYTKKQVDNFWKELTKS